MQRANAKRNYSTTVLMIAVLVVLIALAVVFLGRMNELETVNVVRVGNPGSEAYLSDEAIIRASGLKLGASINAIDEMKEIVERNINEMGLISFVSVERESKNAARLTVNVRTPVIAASVGSSFAVIDRDGFVMQMTSSLNGMNVLRVDGMSLNNPEVGRNAATQPQSQLDEILKIACIVVDSGYSNMISNLSIYNGMYRMITESGLMVRFYLGDNIEETLRITNAFVNQGYKDGEVIISNGQVSYNPRKTDDAEEW